MAHLSRLRQSIAVLALSVAGLLSVAESVSASTIVARLDSLTGGSIDRTISNSTVGPTTATSLQAGQLNFTRQGGTYTGTLLPGVAQQFIAFCAEAQANIDIGSVYTFEVLDLSAGANNIGGMGVVRANYVRELLAAVNPLGGLNAVQAAALQVAIWEIVRESPTLAPFNVTTGNTFFGNAFNPSVLTTAQNWLNTIINDGVQGPLATNVVALVSQTNQDVIGFIRVPEPASFGLLAVGLVGAGLVSRRRRR